MNSQKIKRLTRNAMLATAALIIFVVEAQIPLPLPIPGVKLGLANVVTVYAMFLCGPLDTFAILLCRIVLGTQDRSCRSCTVSAAVCFVTL